MKLFSYVVARDYGFAPNPFFGVCTLATCKPLVRASAATGDWVIGTGAKTKYDLAGHLIYAMQVDEILTFDQYWDDPRFVGKRPVLNGSLKQLYGDNIYHRGRGRWLQADSHHSLDRGRPNQANITRDTSVDRVLLGHKFAYFGGTAPLIPKRFRAYGPEKVDICRSGQGHRIAPDKLTAEFAKWLEGRNEWGLLGMPIEFGEHRRPASTSLTRIGPPGAI